MPWITRTRLALSLKGLMFQRASGIVGVVGGVAMGAVIVLAALMLRLGLSPWLTGSQFITFFPAVIVTTLLCGTLPGLFAVGLSAVMSLPLFGAIGLTPQVANSMALFSIVGMMDVAIISAVLGANAVLRTSLAQIERLGDKVRASEARFRDLIETAPDAMVIADGDQRIVLVNAEAERLFGYRRFEMVGQPIDMLMPAEFRDAHADRIIDFLARPRIQRMGYGRELFGLRSNGVRFPIETNLSILPDAEASLISSAIRDITERRNAEERQGLLIRELNHRVKNTLASVQAIVHQTLKSSNDPKIFSDAFTARLAALSQSHDVLTRNDWSGALVREIVAEQLSPYERSAFDGRPVQSRFELEGPDIKLSPNRAVTLGMTIGELATNAAKYGALSDGGLVDVQWRGLEREGKPWLSLTWHESGGPAVKAPHHRGFGTRLIERSLAGLNGSAHLRFMHEGVTCDLEFPLLPGES